MSDLSTAQPARVLAIDPYTRGIGFAVLEGRRELVDWGLKEARKEKHVQCLKYVENLIKTYRPDVVVIEDIHDKSCRRCLRVRELIEAIEQLVKARGMKVRSFSCTAIQAVFSASQGVTKQKIAEIIVECFPELAPWQPPVRKAWMSEDPRVRLFTAIALAMRLVSSLRD